VRYCRQQVKETSAASRDHCKASLAALFPKKRSIRSKTVDKISKGDSSLSRWVRLHGNPCCDPSVGGTTVRDQANADLSNKNPSPPIHQ